MQLIIKIKVVSIPPITNIIIIFKIISEIRLSFNSIKYSFIFVVEYYNNLSNKI